MNTVFRPASSVFEMFALFCCFLSSATIGASAQDFRSLYSFCTRANCPDGNSPNGWMVQGYDGNLYGTTAVGGSGFGTVFKITTSGALTTLHSFNDTDGYEPSALTLGADGNFYGTTQSGGGESCSRGSNSCGTIFKITPAGTLSTLYRFCSKPNCADGYSPAAALVQGSDGNFYGTTEDGGAAGQCGPLGCGTIFRVTPTGAFMTLYTFCPQGNCGYNAPDGAHPLAALVQGADGSFYGTTEAGGSTANNCIFGCGTVFRITRAGVLTTLHVFDGDGIYPGQIVQALDGNFYGVTAGSIFRINPVGVFATMYSFSISDGDNPTGLLQATDGNLYGVTSQGSNRNCVFGCGTIFKLSLNGTLTTLHAFDGSDGGTPLGGLVQGTDGSFYGTTSKGGSSQNCQGGCGTVFKIGVALTPFVEARPSLGGSGAQVNLLGSNLSGASAVTFNGTAATFSVVSASQITATVPSGATTGMIRVTVPAGSLTSNTDFHIPGPYQFVSVTPCRLIDTRQTNSPIQGGTSRNFTLPQLGGCGIPASAAAYSLNVTVSPHGPLGYLIVWTQGEVRPFASTMNSPDGRTKANAAIVAAGNDAISVYASDTTDLILDIDGYFATPGSTTDQFYPLTPCRIVDTRGADGPLSGPYLTGLQERDFPIPQSPCIPQNDAIKAYSFNVTVKPHPAGQRMTYLKIWPQGEPEPAVSTLNNPTATTVANAALVAAGTNGGIAVFPSDDTDLLIDINGYFAAPGSGGLSLYPVPTCRALDTRGVGSGQPFTGELTVNVSGSACQPPSGARGYVFNATVIPVHQLGYLTLWPDGEPQPTVSTLNAPDGLVTSNMAIVPTNNGSIDAFASALTQLILDISSYFAP